MADRQRPNHEVKGGGHGVYSSTGFAHARRNSTVYAAATNAPVAARAEPQRQVTELQEDGSRDPGTHGIPYGLPAAGPSPMPYTPTQTPVSEPEVLPIEHHTEESIKNDISHFINEEMEPGGQHAWCYENADEKPPITPDSLAELDMPRIINSPKLRHDVNFDRELHFRPNLDGSKGKQKMQQADQYWRALQAELFMNSLALQRRHQSPDNAPYWERIGKESLKRLPHIFKAVRDILKTLVPDHDQKVVKERLDVEHIMQQIQNGVCDLFDLGNWLAKVLKNHCAPMRDALVDSMQKEIKLGATNNDCEQLASGLRLLMNILEAMKLDVANHQIRHMRPLLIDDTINFQRRYNLHRIQLHKINPVEARRWMNDHIQPFGFESAPLHAVTRALIQDLLYNDSSSFCPQTFYLDSDRLKALRLELHNRVYHAICRDVLREIASPAIPQAHLTEAYEALHHSVTAIVGAHGKFAERFENIAAEIVRVLLVVEDHFPPYDLALQEVVERKLVERLRRDGSAFRENAQMLADTLIAKIKDRIHNHVRLSALDLHEILVPVATSPPSRHSMGFGAVYDPMMNDFRPMPVDRDEDIIRRFTHIIALHWQVWADIVYLAPQQDADDDSVSDNGSTSTVVQSQQGSPTIPVATAVYAPGRKWLPVSVTVTDVPSGLPSPATSPKPEDGEMADPSNEENLDQQQRQPA
ncbi:hypothetical protein DOTSEDRAFT_72217 [Dothistroma septosporum NZE10]|uniref:Uncharacterized protein n=1 Tax=Dothistroma septosporum (strain NZE10 / CBS 128990) TaxID=675120 RepID=N1PMQ6_DOTSN|nr:hypothetical protein DOTSEDRAFT_72217 [Dothistroma septosporum NZE10]